MSRDFNRRKNLIEHSSNNEEDNINMHQIFGKEPYYQDKCREPSEIDFEGIRIGRFGIEQGGYSLFILTFLILGIYQLVQGHWQDLIGGLLYALVSVLLVWKLKFKNTETLNYYLANATITLKALLSNIKLLTFWVENDSTLWVISLGLIYLQHFVLVWVLPNFLSSFLYEIAYYGILISGLALFSQRKTRLLFKGLFVYTLYSFISTILSVGQGSLNYLCAFDVLVYWTLSCCFLKCQIKDISISRKGE